MKKTRSISLLHLLFFLLVNSAANAQLTSKQIDSLAQRSLEKFKVAGLAVAVVKDGKIIHGKGYGVKSMTTKKPVDSHTNFQIASNSKAFTAAALAILIDEGKISWKDKVKKHIPEFKMYNEYVTENFMIEDLLCHRSGLGLGVGDLMFFPDGSDFTFKDIATSFQYFKPVSAFRTQFDYDNLLYFVAGEIIARVSGMTWEQFVTARIIKPLQMDNSFTSLNEMKDKSNMATPHSTENMGNGQMRTLAWFQEMVNGAAGAIVSNVDDMSKWMITQLNKGKYGSNLEKQLFSEARQREMWTIHTVTGVNRDPRYNSHFGGYGLGWGLSDLRGNMHVGHTGGLPGMLSVVNLVPDLKLGIVILTNTESGGAGAFRSIGQTIIDSYIKAEPVDWIERYSEQLAGQRSNGDSVTTNVWKVVAAAKNTPVKAGDFVGIYEDNWFGKVEVFLKNNHLWFKCLRSPKLNGPMHFYKANTFAIKWEYQDMNCDAFAMFSLDEEGKAQSIKMKGISPNIDFSFDFHDLDLKRVGK
ncbi:serine hydrolase [Dyadobacter sp. CY323]|uniref:serine hydrolase n=1 Tax=Dyadobacter sp. CY323 TaxID=2907302 RepID=UPI001F404E05|nr:serine hydrolase [Dyadobacter sp. CY323]MCE6992670.1 serine hydrolase [Dyadobacter sp. CY323]